MEIIKGMSELEDSQGANLRLHTRAKADINVSKEYVRKINIDMGLRKNGILN